MKNNSNEYFKKYFLKFLNLCDFRKDFSKFNKIKDELIKCKKRNKKIAIFGNGESAAISSHFSVDLTKIPK